MRTLVLAFTLSLSECPCDSAYTSDKQKHAGTSASRDDGQPLTQDWHGRHPYQVAKDSARESRDERVALWLERG